MRWIYISLVLIAIPIAVQIRHDAIVEVRNLDTHRSISRLGVLGMAAGPPDAHQGLHVFECGQHSVAEVRRHNLCVRERLADGKALEPEKLNVLVIFGVVLHTHAYAS